MKNHPKAEFLGKLVIEEIEIDQNGMVYFTADDHIFRFDGKDFYPIPLTNYKYVASIEIIGDKMYFIGQSGFGYVQFTENGEKVVNLVTEFDHLEAYKGGKRVFEKDGLIYYLFEHQTVIFNPFSNTATVKEYEEKMHIAFHFKDDILVQRNLTHIYRSVKDSLIPVFNLVDENGDRVISTINGITEVKGDTLIGIRNEGLFKVKGDQIVKLDNQLSRDIGEKRGYSFQQLSSDLYAVVSINEGVILYDRNFNRVKTISIDDGIINNIAFSMAMTKRGDLILGCINGLSILHLGTPITVIDERYEIPNNPVLGFSSEPVHNRFYFVNGATVWGCDIEGENEGQVKPYYKVPNVALIGAFLRVHKDELYFAETVSGIFRLKEDGQVDNVAKVFTDRLLLISDDNFVILQENVIANYNRIDGTVDTLVDFGVEGFEVNNNINMEVSKPHNSVFVADRHGQIYHLQMDKMLHEKVFFEKIGKPVQNFKSFQTSKTGLLFTNGDYIVNYDIKTKTFKTDEGLSELFKAYEIKPQMFTDNNFNIWFTHPIDGTRKFIANGKGGYNEDDYVKEIRRVGKEEWGLLTVTEKHTFLLAPKGLFHLDHTKINPETWGVKPYFTSITSIIGDTTYFGGLSVDKNGVSYAPQGNFSFDSDNNNLRVEFGAIYYGDHKNLEYRLRVPGYQDDWSKWSTENFKELPNITEGNYSIELQVRDFYRIVDRTETYSFTVLPPWYRTIWAYIAYVILGVGFVYLVVYLNSRRLLKQKKELEKVVDERTAEIRMQNETLQQQTEEIQTQAEDLEYSNRQLEKRNVQITDSINYAKKIQKARLLPMRSKLIGNCGDSFVLFEPKDIVSGDFYWYHEGENYEYICVADCTGHGVPGAFMSILGVDTLEKIIHKGFVEPNHILDELSNEIHTLLRKNNAGVKDGMDLTIVAISKDKKVAKIAGVENPVYVVRNGEMIQFKTDKNPIGNIEGDKYSVQEMELQQGDVIYQFTDGFADQKGGPKNKKFFYPPFRKLLVELSTENFAHQERQLKQTFNDWRGSNEQYDDVCIIGYRIS